MTEAEVKAVADGRIMNGRQAVEANLADDFGFEEDVLAALQTDFDLKGAEVFEYGASEGLGSLLSMKVQSLFSPDMESKMIAKLLTDYSAPRMMYLYGEN
jgi:protease-4